LKTKRKEESSYPRLRRGSGDEKAMGKRYGFGIVGCGAISKAHIESIKALPNAQIVGVVDKVLERAKAVGEKEGCAYYDDPNELFARADLDIVCICTPSGLHAEPAIAAANAGKHLIVEKPLEITLKRIDDIIEACERNNVKLTTILPCRFKDSNRFLHKKLQEGRFGKLILGDTYVKWYRSPEYYASGGWRGTWAMDGGGALMNQSIHQIDLLQWMMGDVSSVFAHSETLLHDIETEDTAVALLKFKNGAVGVIEGATSIYPGLPKRLEIHGSNGTAIIEDDNLTRWEMKDLTEDEKAEVEQLLYTGKSSATYSDPMGFSFEGHRKQIKDMVDALDEDREPFVDSYEGRKSVEIITAIYRSAREGRQVNL
jgi:UDP-N-acetyl-2-amino-2-deoxyglucuronate dehydrogenase